MGVRYVVGKPSNDYWVRFLTITYDSKSIQDMVYDEFRKDLGSEYDYVKVEISSSKPYYWTVELYDSSGHLLKECSVDRDTPCEWRATTSAKTAPTTTTPTTTGKEYVTHTHEFTASFSIDPYGLQELWSKPDETKYVRWVIPSTIQKVASDGRVLKAEVYVEPSTSLPATTFTSVKLNGIDVSGTLGKGRFQGTVEDKGALTSIFSQSVLELSCGIHHLHQHLRYYYNVRVVVTMEAEESESQNITNETKEIKTTQQDRTLGDDTGGNKDQNTNPLTSLMSFLQQLPQWLMIFVIIMMILEVVRAFRR